MNSKIYSQLDSRWSSLPYPTKSSSFGGNGCGCCACLHVIIELDKYKNWTPKDLRPWMVQQGFAVANQGTTWAGIPKTLQHFGFGVINHPTMNDIFTTLDKRKKEGKACLGVILFRSGTRGGITWTAGGHYVAFTDYKVSGNKHYFYTKDSGGREHSGWYCYETQMQGLIPQIWSALMPNDVKQTTETVKKEATKDSTKASSQNEALLVVDGVAGKDTISAAQKFFGTPVTGEFGGQLKKHKKLHTGFYNNVYYGSGGSALIKAMQKYMKMSDPDGYLGPNTIKAIQKMVGITQSGTWDKATSKAFQQWLNKQSGRKATPSITPSKKIKGMDISTWQGKISVANFKKAKADGINFVILRIGYTGSSSNKPTLDDVFENNYKNAIEAGLPVGIYYYSLATTGAKAKEEANFVIKNLKGKKISYPVYIDMEDPNKQAKASKATLASVCNEFCDAIKAAGYTPGVYASLSWFNNKIGAITSSHTKWVAQYYTECQYKGAYDMWQYTSSGKVAGLSGNIDLNYWYKK